MQAPTARAVERLLALLEPAERPVLMRLLAKLTGAMNEATRVPMQTDVPTPDWAEPAQPLKKPGCIRVWAPETA